MTLAARLLPLIAVIALAVTLALPILDSANENGPRLMVTSLGGEPFDVTETKPAFLIAWIAVSACAASVWMFRSLKWWSIATIVVSVGLGALLVATILDPPWTTWSGIDTQGRETGGAEVAEPAAGAIVWIAGITALLVAGVLGIVDERKTIPTDPA